MGQLFYRQLIPLPAGGVIGGASDLDDVQTHVDDVLGAGAVVARSGVTLEGVAEVTVVQVVIAKVIMTSPGGGGGEGE